MSLGRIEARPAFRCRFSGHELAEGDPIRSAIRLIALDIDGTLLDSRGELPAANIAALARALGAGIEIVLATGRRYDFALPVVERLPRPLTLILSNGAIVKTDRGETRVRHLLPRAVAADLLAAAPEHRGTAALLFDRPRERQIVYERVPWHDRRQRAFFAANRPFITEVTPLEAALTEDPLQLMFTGRCAEMRALFERLRAHGLDSGQTALVASAVRRKEAGGEDSSLPPDGGSHRGSCGDAPLAVVAPAVPPLACSVALTEYAKHDFSLVDAIRAGCSKGAALAEWAEGRGVPRASIMAVGDNLNDLSMLEFAGHPVVMANGLAELKARGWAMTTSNDEAGVARAIDEILAVAPGVQDRRGV